MSGPARPRWPSGVSHPLASPLQPSVVYVSDTPDSLDAQYDGRVEGHVYAREGHPNADVVAGLIDAMEGIEGGLMTGSGMAAITAVLLGLTRAGGHVIAGDRLYGRSMRLLTQDLPRLGVEVTLVDASDGQSVRAALRETTRVVLVETITNPSLVVSDMPAIAAALADHPALLAVDNTFTTPRGFKPALEGADIVIHSVTKLLSGHSDATLGYVAATSPDVRQELRDCIETFGLTPAPFDCWLAERGLYSFDLRHQRASANAAHLADALAQHPAVRRVVYPGRADHPQHNQAMALFGGQAGNMLSFEIEGGRDEANALTTAAKSIAFAPTLGDVSTTLSHPASSSHRKLTPDERAALGLSEGFFRVSVGIEDAVPLAETFRAALDQIGAGG